MGNLRMRLALGAAVVGLGVALGAPAFADGGGFTITSPQSGSTIPSNPTIRGTGTPGDRVAVDAVNQQRNEVEGTCHTTVGANGTWACTISPPLKRGTYRVVAFEIPPGSTRGAEDNEVAEVRNLTVRGQLPVTPGADPMPAATAGLVLLTGGGMVVAATRNRRRGRHAA